MNQFRGRYVKADHVMSNDFAIAVSKMFSKVYNAEVERCIVNEEYVGKRPYFIKEDFGMDLVVKMKGLCPAELLDLTKNKSTINIEIEAKKITYKQLAGEKIWPSRFGTIDFGYLKYRKPKDTSQYKDHFLKVMNDPDVELLHFLCLEYVDASSNGLYAWVMNFKDFTEEHVGRKYTMRGSVEKFYMVPKTDPNLRLFDLKTGKIIPMV